MKETSGTRRSDSISYAYSYAYSTKTDEVSQEVYTGTEANGPTAQPADGQTGQPANELTDNQPGQMRHRWKDGVGAR